MNIQTFCIEKPFNQSVITLEELDCDKMKRHKLSKESTTL